MAEESVDILESIGFMPDTARLIYQRYCDSPNQDPAKDCRSNQSEETSGI
jgi:hypothetical protein